MENTLSQLKLKKYFVKNTLGITTVEFFWGLGIPVLLESTFIQLFLRNLGAGSFIIGLLPFFIGFATPFTSLLAAYLTQQLAYKKYIVMLVHLLTAIPIFLYGIYLHFFNQSPAVLPFFLITYAFFSLGMGLILPVWQNYLVKIFIEKDTLKAISIMSITQNLAKLGCSFLLIKIVEKYSLSAKGASIVFLIIGVSLMIGSFFFLLTKEQPEDMPPKKPAWAEKLQLYFSLLKSIFKNKNFMYFIVNDMGYYATINIISFYAHYATLYCQINPALVAGLFVAFSYLGAICVQITFGWFDLFTLKNKYLTSKLLALTGIVLLCLKPNQFVFFIICFLLGASKAIRLLANPSSIKKISRQTDATAYFALTTFTLLPVTTGLPLINGLFLDLFAGLGALSYQIMFLSMGVIVLFSSFFLLKVKF